MDATVLDRDEDGVVAVREATSPVNTLQLMGFQLGVFAGDEDTANGVDATMDAARHPGDRYTAVWYHDGTTAFKKAPTDLYLDYLNDDDEGDENPKAIDNMDERGTVWVDGGWASTTDKDGDPLYGDLGKVDVHAKGDDIKRAGEADNFGNTDNDKSCTTDDGGTAAAASSDGKTVKTPGSSCDAEDVEIETTVMYTDNFGDQACSVEVSYTITCQWDADGEISRSRNENADDVLIADNPETADVNESNIDNFLKCTAEMN